MLKKEKIKELSRFGCFLYNLEFKFCKNIRIFIGRNEKTIEIIFIFLFFTLQGLLAFYVFNLSVTFMIILFLLLLSLKRICIHIWLDYERESIKRAEDKSKEIYDNLRFNAYQEITYLSNELTRLDERLKNLKKQR